MDRVTEPEAPAAKPDPFARVLLMARVCELEELMRRQDEVRAALAAQIEQYAGVVREAATTMTRLLALGADDVDVVLTAARQSADDAVRAAAEELAANQRGRDAIAFGLRTAAALRAAGTGQKT